MTAPNSISRIVLTAACIGALADVAAASDPLVLELRIVTHGALDRSNLEIARETCQKVLASAGIQSAWRECGAGEPCDDPSGQPVVLVHLFPTTKSTDPARAGETMSASETTMPVVVVYVQRNQELAQTLRQSSAARSNPVLSSVTTGDLVGVWLAHEVGHVLGLRHASAGVMKAQLAPEDILALRASVLGFRRAERDQMQRALVEGAVRD